MMVTTWAMLWSVVSDASPRRAPRRTTPRVTRTQANIGLLQRQWKQALPTGRQRDTLTRRTTRAQAVNSMLTAARHPRQHKVKPTEAIGALLGIAEKEPHRALQMYAVGALLHRKVKIPRTLQTRFDAVKKTAFPKNPRIPKTGPVQIRHFVGDEFFRGEVAGYRRQGFTVTSDGHTATATRGRLKVKVYKGDDRIFRHMKDPNVHVVIFSGHSNVGGVNELSLKGAPKQKGDKLVLLLQCAGVQTMPLVGARYNRAHLITTKSSSYASADWNIIRSVLDGAERGESYGQIRGHARRRGDISNYLFPDHLRSAKYWDMDRDGHLDNARGRLADKRYNVQQGTTRTPGQKLMSAVRFLNSTNKYYVDDTPRAVFTAEQVCDTLYCGGVANKSRTRPGTKAKRMTQIRTQSHQGRQVHEGKLDPRFKRASKAVVAANSIYEMSSHLTRKVLGRETKRDKLRGLLFAGDYLYRLTGSYTEARCAMDRVCKMKSLPKISYSDVERVIHMDKNLGTNKQLDALERLWAANGR